MEEEGGDDPNNTMCENDTRKTVTLYVKVKNKII